MEAYHIIPVVSIIWTLCVIGNLNIINKVTYVTLGKMVLSIIIAPLYLAYNILCYHDMKLY